jgi:hypothetical protein
MNVTSAHTPLVSVTTPAYNEKVYIFASASRACRRLAAVGHGPNTAIVIGD